MKNKLLPILMFFAWITSLSALSAQDSQLISKEINYTKYSDASYKSMLNSSGFFDFNAKILWNYANQTLEITDLTENTTWLKTTYKTEVNPDNIKGDENFRFEFDPTKNELKIKVIKIYMKEDGSFTYKIEADKQKIEITGIEPDTDYNGVGDYTQQNTGSVYNQDHSTQGLKSLYLNNTTPYDVYVGVKLKDNWYNDWTVSNWIKIATGTKAYIGDLVEDFFYYYAYCVDNNQQYIIWDGKDENIKVGTDGPYGFRKVALTEGKMVDDKNWSMDIYISK